MAILEKNHTPKTENGKKKRKRSKNKKNTGDEEQPDLAVPEFNDSEKEEVEEIRESLKEDETEIDQNKQEEDDKEEEKEIKTKKKKKKLNKSSGESGIMTTDSFTSLPLSEPTIKGIMDLNFQYMTQVIKLLPFI